MIRLSNFQLELRKGVPIEVFGASGEKDSSSHVPVESKSSPPFIQKYSKDALKRSGNKDKKSPFQESGHGVVEGSLLGISTPHYPESSRLRGEEGKVLLKLSFDSKKALVKVEIVESSGYLDLDRSALLQTAKDLPRSEATTVAFEHLVQFNFVLSRAKDLPKILK